MTPDPYFDTQQAVRALEAAGMRWEAAEAIVETTRAARGGLVTQEGMKAAIADLKDAITVRMVGLLVLALGVAKLLF